MVLAHLVRRDSDFIDRRMLRLMGRAGGLKEEQIRDL